MSAHGPGAVPRRLGLFVLLTAVMVMAAACGSGEEPTGTPSVDSDAVPAVPGEETPKRGGVLTLANRGDPPAAFDTMRTSSIALHHVGGAIFGPGNLVRRCRENMYLVCPDLASNWIANPGFTEWEFTIRPNVTWHDGEPFTAEDVQFWYGLAADGWESDGAPVRAPAYFRGDLGDIESVEVLEFNRVRVTLAEPNPHYLTVLANPRLRIAHPKHLMAPLLEEGEYSVAPLDVGAVGTGPFKLDRYEAGSLVRVVRNDDYWERGAGGNLPYLDGIDYVVMPNPTAMDAAFRTGRIDGGARGEGHYLTQERKAAIDSQLGPDEVFYGEMQGGMFRLGFNVLREGPWQDAQVRQAISLWIDRETAIPTVLGGFGYISPTFSPANPFTSADFTTWQRFNRGALEERRAEAVALMAEAGQADGFEMGYLCRARLTARCEFLHNQLAGLGIDMQIHLVDEAEWNRGRVSLDYDSQPGSNFTSPIPEGTEAAYGVYSRFPDAYAKHEDAHVTLLYEELRATRTHRQRVAAWREIERYVVRDRSYVVPIAGTIQVVPYRTYVKGLVIPPEDGHTHTDFATVWLDK